MEETLKRTETTYKELFNNMSSGVVVYEQTGGGQDFIIKDFNSAAEQIERIKREDVIGKNIMDVFPGVRDFGLLDVLQRVSRTGKPEHHPVSIYKDERVMGWRENYVYKLPCGEIVSVYNDVTERKREELAIRMSEQCFRAIADYTYFWEIWVSPGGHALWTNPAVERITGYTVQEFLIMPEFLLPMVYEEDRKKIAEALNSALKQYSGTELQFRLQKKNGSLIWADFSWQSIYDAKGKCQGFRASIRDITERKIAQESLKKEKERAQQYLDMSGNVFLMLDKNGIITMINKKGCEIIGYRQDELIGRYAFDFVPERVQAEAKADWEKLMAGDMTTAEYNESAVLTKSGQERIIAWHDSVIRDEKGNIMATLHSGIDITESKRAER